MILASRADGPRDAPPLVLLGSLGSSTAMWDPVIGSLAEQFRVIRIDHRGHGASTAAPPGATVAIADLAGDVEQTIDSLELERVHLAGLSLGAMIGIWLAVHRPQRVARLGLFCTAAHLPPAQGWLDRAATVREHGVAAIASGVVARWVTPALARRDPELVAALEAMLTDVDADSYAQCCEAIAGMDQRADLPRIAAPTLVLGGADDLATPTAHQRQLADAITCARLQIIEDAAHVATLEQPGRIAAAMLEHFRGGATLASGFVTRRAVLGDAHVDASVAATTSLTRPFQEFITRYAWGDVWSRAELSRRDRSIATLAALIALGAEHEVAMHVRAARRNGLTDEQIAEVVLHTALYAGLPRANRALAIASDVLAAPDPAGPDPAGPDPAAPEPAGPEPAGTDPAAPDRTDEGGRR